MRPVLKMLPLPLLLLAALPAAAQEAPRVLFCSGACFAVDANGVRTPAPKGTRLAPGQRLETGPNAYAQVRMGRDAALGIGEQARVAFQGNAVNLDEGRVRLIGGAALGRPGAAPVELRTGDGTFVLRSPDIEVKKALVPGTGIAQTLVKLNSGDAGLRSGQGQIRLPRQNVQAIAAGKLVSGAPLAPTALAPSSRPTLTRAPARTAPIAANLTPIRMPTTITRDPIVLAPTLSPTLSPTILSQPTLAPVVSTGDTLLRQPIVDSTTGTTTTLTRIVSEPILTTTTTLDKTYTIQPTTTISPTLSPTTSTLRLIRR